VGKTVRSLDEIKTILKKHENELREKYGVKRIGIFGSVVRGEAGEESDVDILVELERPIGLLEFLELEEYISNLIGMKVDLVSKKALKPPHWETHLGRGRYGVKRSYKDYILDILTSIDEIEEFTEGMDFEEFIGEAGRL